MKMGFIIALSLLFISSSSFAQKKSDTTEIIQLESHGDPELVDDSAFMTVHAKYTVEPSGKVSKIVIVKNFCPTCNKKQKKGGINEARELIQKNPAAPRKDSSGKPKRTIYLQSFVFRLTEI